MELRGLLRGKRRGNSVLEFTFVGIPIIFILISIFEMARGMWTYHTLAYASKEGTRYAIVHGQNCVMGANNCAVTVANIARVIKDAGVGLDPARLRLTFISNTRTIPENTLENYLNDTATYFPTYAKGVTPPDTGGNAGNLITILATYRFESALALFWPGAGSGMIFGTLNFPASSRERIQF